MKRNNSNLISKYWKAKLLSREINIGLNNKNSNVPSITINSDDLIYLNKLTNNNPKHNIRLSVLYIIFLVKRFVTEFDGFMVSNYENQSNTLVLSLFCKYKCFIQRLLDK